jgi:hypothetical protein
MSSAHVTLTVAGGIFDIGGALLVASNEIGPRFAALSARVRRVAIRAWTRARSLVRRGRHHTVFVDPGIASAKFSGTGSLISGVQAGATTEQKLEFLLGQALKNQERLNELERLAAELPKRWRVELASTRESILETLADTVREVETRRIATRILGVICVAVGGLFQAAANLVA